MARVRSAGNKSTEIRFKRLLSGNGITGWRRGAKVFGRPDFVFYKQRLAVFVDGCFWHGHPTLCRLPKSNRGYWKEKIEGNRRRDQEVTALLIEKGWTVLRIWEHELRIANEPRLLRRIMRHLR
jgi:DNA mismatch endonuclease (patch repair protein)